jgi:hypothetical protein
MNKINLLTSETDLTSFNATYFAPLLEKYFNILYYDPTITYDKSSTIVVVGFFNQNKWYQKLEDSGFKILVDNLWELPKIRTDGKFVCYNENWFWYNESLWYKSILGYDTYIPNKSYSKLALMPMRLKKPHRDQLFKSMTPFLNNFIFSYIDNGIRLPGDIDKKQPDFTRYFNPAWYDCTYFSIVSETLVAGDQLFVTEKTFKPIAFYHPYMICSQPGVLKFLKNLGFETFDNLFDESYDNNQSFDDRLSILVENVKNFNPAPHDSLTLSKLEHNHNLFFNEQIVNDRIITEIINPILEYVETQ